MDATSTASFRWLKHAKTFPRHQDRLSAPQQTADLFATEQEHRDRQIAIERIESLAQSDRIKNEFLATVCHELRSPIGAIQNAVKVLRSPNNAAIPLQHQMCALIERQSQQMAFLVAGLLDITSIGRGQLCLHRQLVDLSAILRNAIETLEWDLKGRCHRLEISGLESPVWLMADAARLEQVFANLLGNASKYTAAGTSRTEAQLCEFGTRELALPPMHCHTSSIYLCRSVRQPSALPPVWASDWLWCGPLWKHTGAT
jgi:signal transduction histidine kinase